MQEWYPPDLANNLRSGLGSWSNAEIVAFLRTGRNGRTAAYGPMSEVITHSTSKLDDRDLKVIATYLKDMPAPAPSNKPAKPNAEIARAGQTIYIDNCSARHKSNGEGVPGAFPPLKGDTAAQGSDPTSMIRVILDGAQAVDRCSSDTIVNAVVQVEAVR